MHDYVFFTALDFGFVKNKKYILTVRNFVTVC